MLFSRRYPKVVVIIRLRNLHHHSGCLFLRCRLPRVLARLAMKVDIVTLDNSVARGLDLGRGWLGNLLLVRNCYLVFGLSLRVDRRPNALLLTSRTHLALVRRNYSLHNKPSLTFLITPA